MYYVILGTDAPDSLPIRQRVRPAHLDRLQELVDQGRVLAAGPMPRIDNEDPGEAGFSGSLIIAEFASLEAAREWAAGDPYTSEGVFSNVEVRPFKRVMP
jgi:uncharacterized protein YciI